MSSPNADSTRLAVARLLGADVLALDPLHGGRNSQVFRAALPDGRAYAVKRYFEHPADPRDRLGVEFAAFEFLRTNGVVTVPEAIAQDRAAGIGVYEFVPGELVVSTAVTETDVDGAAAFLGDLIPLREPGRAAGLPAAAEACFSIDAVLAVVDRRLARLERPAAEGELLAELARFLDRELMPALETTRGWVREQAGSDAALDLPLAERILTPSDFGFHNAIRRPDGRTVYVDFEYFGWDDPTKTIADFVLHPGMVLDEALRGRFVARMLDVVPGADAVRRRLELVYPLHGLKWCLILLNEFTEHDLSRRRYARPIHTEREELQREQLSRARALLRRLTNEHGHFPDAS